MLVMIGLLSTAFCATGFPDFGSWRDKATERFSAGVRDAGEEMKNGALSRADEEMKSFPRMDKSENLPSDALENPEADSKPELD